MQCSSSSDLHGDYSRGIVGFFYLKQKKTKL